MADSVAESSRPAVPPRAATPADQCGRFVHTGIHVAASGNGSPFPAGCGSAALSPQELQSLAAAARSLGLDVLVEVHNADELSVALDSDASVIGVNNRNLRTLEVDVHASEALIARMPRGIVAISESGLKSADDITRLRTLGYRGFLVGERFMTEEDPGAGLARLLEARWS